MQFLVFLLVLVQVSGTLSASVQLSIFYETLCNDSIRFITTQLLPTYKYFGGFGNPYFQLELNPYGKAETYVGSGGQYNFTCQHDPLECEGNMMHACALKHIQPTNRLEFIACTMNSTIPPLAGGACAKELHLDFTPIETCTKDGSGTKLLAEYGDSTKALRPPLVYVPWVLFDNVYSEWDLWESQINLTSVICEKLDRKTIGYNKVCNNASPGFTCQLWLVILCLLVSLHVLYY